MRVHQGWITGPLEPGEDRAALEEALRTARERVLAGAWQLLLHADQQPEVAPPQREEKRAQRVALLRQGRLKRFVVQVETAAGWRIVKLMQPSGVGDHALGLLGWSPARREDALHQRAEQRGLAAVRRCGFLEWREGWRLRASCHVQQPTPAGAETLGAFFAAEYRAFGTAAVVPLAACLARVHAQRFFHGDLKGFHAYVENVRPAAGEGPRHYDVRWIDLDRIGFALTRRQRIINLYQALRFIVPPDAAAQEKFIAAYCQQAPWHAAEPQRALALVRAFLHHKLRTHPHPFL